MRPRTLKGFTGELDVSFHKQTPERKSYPPLNVVFFFHIMSTVISLFITVMNHSYISVSELPAFHIHVRLYLKIQTEFYAASEIHSCKRPDPVKDTFFSSRGRPLTRASTVLQF